MQRGRSGERGYPAAFLAASIDEEVGARNVAVDRAEHMASMLVVVRDIIRPLPERLASEGAVTDSLRTCLVTLTLLRTARECRRTTERAGHRE